MTSNGRVGWCKDPQRESRGLGAKDLCDWLVYRIGCWVHGYIYTLSIGMQSPLLLGQQQSERWGLKKAKDFITGIRFLKKEEEEETPKEIDRLVRRFLQHTPAVICCAIIVIYRRRVIPPALFPPRQNRSIQARATLAELAGVMIDNSIQEKIFESDPYVMSD